MSNMGYKPVTRGKAPAGADRIDNVANTGKSVWAKVFDGNLEAGWTDLATATATPTPAPTPEPPKVPETEDGDE